MCVLIYETMDRLLVYGLLDEKDRIGFYSLTNQSLNQGVHNFITFTNKGSCPGYLTPLYLPRHANRQNCMRATSTNYSHSFSSRYNVCPMGIPATV